MSGSERFVYYGNASVLSGHLHEPRDIDVDLGGSALHLGGGRSCFHADAQRFGDVVAFASADTHAHGASPERAKPAGRGGAQTATGPAQAVVGVEVRALTLGRSPALSVKHLGAILTAHCPPTSTEPSMGTLDDARFEGVAVGKYRLSVSINRAFFKTHDTLSKLSAASGDAGRAQARASGPVLATPRTQDGTSLPILTTIVKNLRWLEKPFPGSAIDRHVLTIPRLGRVFFGEMFVSGATRRLTMLRFELAGEVVFAGACCEVEVGGHWWR